MWAGNVRTLGGVCAHCNGLNDVNNHHENPAKITSFNEVIAMNCHQVQSQFAALSAGELPSAAGAALKSHCIGCPPCRREWEDFQNTLLLLSTVSQPLPSDEVSCEMWSVCAEEIFQRIEQRRAVPLSWRERTLGWLQQQPRWGWAALGAAIAIFGSVWVLTPDEAPQNGVLEASLDGGPIMRIGAPRATPNDFGSLPVRVHFEPAPAGTSSAVDYHAAMSFDPFVDYVGSGLVSSAVSSDAASSTNGIAQPK